MANIDTFFLQPFKTLRKRLVPGQRLPAKTKHHALADGARLGRIAEGVAVLHVATDDEAGESARSSFWSGTELFPTSSRKRSALCSWRVSAQHLKIGPVCPTISMLGLSPECRSAVLLPSWRQRGKRGQEPLGREIARAESAKRGPWHTDRRRARRLRRKRHGLIMLDRPPCRLRTGPHFPIAPCSVNGQSAGQDIHSSE